MKSNDFSGFNDFSYFRVFKEPGLMRFPNGSIQLIVLLFAKTMLFGITDELGFLYEWITMQ